MDKNTAELREEELGKVAGGKSYLYDLSLGDLVTVTDDARFYYFGEITDIYSVGGGFSYTVKAVLCAHYGPIARIRLTESQIRINPDEISGFRFVRKIDSLPEAGEHSADYMENYV